MKLNKGVLEKIYGHALKEYPDECCGIITGNDNEQIVHMCDNIQNKMHAEDPARFPRDARTAYIIDRSKFDSIISYSLKKGDKILALYHSHAEHEAYFSEEDVAAQTVFGEPEFPEALHVVISVMDRKIHDLKCFKWERENQVFFAEDCI
jgi:proteasome lid subunit RPN8/RPN11